MEVDKPCNVVNLSDYSLAGFKSGLNSEVKTPLGNFPFFIILIILAIVYLLGRK